MGYWLIKGILLTALLIVTLIVVRPIKTDSSLAIRRASMFLTLLAAVFAIIFPEIFNRFARSIGVMSGTNLLVYLMVIVILAQMASSFRKDAEAQQKLTVLARKVALMEANQTVKVNSEEPADPNSKQCTVDESSDPET